LEYLVVQEDASTFLVNRDVDFVKDGVPFNFAYKTGCTTTGVEQDGGFACPEGFEVTEIVDRLNQIGFSLAVAPDDPIAGGRELGGKCLVVSKSGQVQPANYHSIRKGIITDRKEPSASSRTTLGLMGFLNSIRT
jgi:hypothetical protein